MSMDEQGNATVAQSEHGRDVVTIIVNSVEREIHRGRQPVSEIKRIGEVPQADQLEQVMSAQQQPQGQQQRGDVRDEDVARGGADREAEEWRG